MNKKMMLQYLKDIVGLESQKRVAYNTYGRLNALENNNKRALGYVAAKPPIFWGEIWKKILIRGLLMLLAFDLVGLVFEMIGFFGMIFHFLGMAAWLIYGICVISRTKMEQTTDYEKSVVQIKNQKMRAHKELPQIQEAKKILKKSFDECQLSLQKLYSLNIIDRKYRDIVPCAMFLEYLSTGRTHSLEATPGDPGAYNLYEDELYKRIIVSKLDQVLESQRILCQEVRNINYSVQQLYGSIEYMQQSVNRIEKNTKISAWYSQVNAYNTSVIRRMHEEYYRNR